MAPAFPQHLTEYEIKSLLIRERFYRDSCQWEKLRQCYHPDTSKTSLRISWFDGDIDGFIAGSKKMAANPNSQTAHTIQPVEVNVQGDKALAISTGSVNVRTTVGSESDEYDILSWVWFVTRLVQVPGSNSSSGHLAQSNWKLVYFEAIYDRDLVAPTSPRPRTTALHVEDARKSYKYLSWILIRSGFAVSQDLPGTDRPGSVKKLMDEAKEWLSS